MNIDHSKGNQSEDVHIKCFVIITVHFVARGGANDSFKHIVSRSQ